MCTAIKDSSLFGRTLDLECSFDEKVIITPKKFEFPFIYEGKRSNRYGIVGTAHLAQGIPLYYDAMNENGLCIAALRFQKLAAYHEKDPSRQNLASFELIPWLLQNFRTAKDAISALERVNITNDSFSDDLPSTPLHWIVADRDQSFTIESVADGLKIYDNQYGVLTNSPDFPSQCEGLAKSDDDIKGDFSSSSRFVRAYRTKEVTAPAATKEETISRFFHIMGTVNQPSGVSKSIDGKPMRTLYTSCMDMDDLNYYFTTYQCRRINSVSLNNQVLSQKSLTCFDVPQWESIRHLN
jgi:choloylglycine hydrolase